jgi:hypothetical protein
MVAAITSSFLTGDGTQGTFIAAFVAAMETAGFTTFDNYTSSSNEQRVFSRQIGSQGFDTAYLRVGFNSDTVLALQGYSAWNATNHTGSDANTAGTNSVSSLSGSYTFHSIAHAEVRGVIWVDGLTPKGFYGYLRPSNIPEWWNENLYPYAFVDYGLDGLFVSVYTPQYFQPNVIYDTLGLISSLRPSGIIEACGIPGYQSLTVPNSVDGNRRTAFDKPLIVDNNSKVATGQFGSDLILCGSGGVSLFDRMQVSIGVEEYTLIENAQDRTALCIRVI